MFLHCINSDHQHNPKLIDNVDICSYYNEIDGKGALKLAKDSGQPQSYRISGGIGYSNNGCFHQPVIDANGNRGRSERIP